jgi:hypothetical protein
VLTNQVRTAQVYSTFAYWLANAVVNLPLLLCTHIVFVEIAYWMIALTTNPWVHLYAMLVTFLNNLIAFYSAQFLASVCSSAEVWS